MIEVARLSRHYPDKGRVVTALQDVDLHLGAGERLGLFGPSGCGKTTLLRCIAGLEVPDHGIIRINGSTVFDPAAGINLPPWRRPVGMVFQDFALWPHMTVLDNVLFPLRHGRDAPLPAAEQIERARNALRVVRLSGMDDRHPGALSGGQRQRVAVARALVSQPAVLLMDEPLSNLDPRLRKQTRNELLEILETAQITTVFVSHDHLDGLFIGDRIGVMRDGRLVQAGEATGLFDAPRDVSVAKALDLGTILDGRIEQHDVDSPSRFVLAESSQFLHLPSDARGCPGAPCHLLIRAGACRLATGRAINRHEQRLAAVVVRSSYMGIGWCVLARVDDVTIEIWEKQRPHVRPRDVVNVLVDMTATRILPGDSEAPVTAPDPRVPAAPLPMHAGQCDEGRPCHAG